MKSIKHPETHPLIQINDMYTKFMFQEKCLYSRLFEILSVTLSEKLLFQNPLSVPLPLKLFLYKG